MKTTEWPIHGSPKEEGGTLLGGKGSLGNVNDIKTCYCDWGEDPLAEP